MDHSLVESLFNLLQYCFCSMLFGLLTRRYVGSKLPNQWSNWYHIHWKMKS